MTVPDAVELTQQLVRIDTRNPPGNELVAAELLADLLKTAGLEVTLHRFGEGRFNVVATKTGATPGRHLMFTGHIDTVPLGNAPWTENPFGGAIVDGLLYGRGATDMKAGVAAMVVAVLAEAETLSGSVTLVLTGGEETGSHGAQALVADKMLASPDLLIVGEPTANRLLSGHKGALWLSGTCTGHTAHGSTPHLGDNALYKAARAVTKLENFEFNAARHPVMGVPTLSVGMLSGGLNINSVPDLAEFTIDIRSVPHMQHIAIIDQLGFTLGAETTLATIVDLPSVWSEPSRPEMQAFASAHAAVTGAEALVATANYFTDASVLTPALGAPSTIICGPGNPDMAHKTDEYCEVAKILEAVEIYRAAIRG